MKRHGWTDVVVDAEQDSPTDEGIALRMEDQMSGQAPRKPPELGIMSLFAPAPVKAEAAAGTSARL